MTLSNLAVLLESRLRFPKAEALHQQTLAMKRRLFGDAHPRVAASLNNLGFCQSQGKLHIAEDYRQALSILRIAIGDDDPRASASVLVGRTA